MYESWKQLAAEERENILLQLEKKILYLTSMVFLKKPVSFS